MKPRLSLVTLGSRDLARAKAFYQRLFGWELSSMSNESVVFFKTGGCAIGIYGWGALAEDAKVAASGHGFRGLTLAHNVGTRSEVALFLSQAEAAGGRIVKAAEDVFWGGHSGYFSDPDGHLWEVAWNPHLPYGPNGELALP